MAKKLTAFMLIVAILLSFATAFAAPSFGTLTEKKTTMGVNSIVRAVATIEDGEPIVVTQVGGSTYSLIEVVSVNDEKILRTFKISESAKAWYGFTDSNMRVHLTVGRNIYIYDPSTKNLSSVGTVPTTWSGTSNGIMEHNGVFYGVSSAYGNVFKYSFGGSITNLCALTNYTSVNGLSGIGAVGNYLYAGGTYSGSDTVGTTLYKINISDGSATAIANPGGKAAKSVGMVTTVGKYIYAQIGFMDGTVQGHFYDTDTNSWISKTLLINANGMSDVIEGKKYYIEPESNTLHSLNITTLETKNLGFAAGSGFWRGSGVAFKCDYFGDETCFIQSQFNGNLYVCCEKGIKHIDVNLVEADQPHRISKVSTNGNVQVTAFMGSFGADYNPRTDENNLYSMGQAEGIVSLGSKTYFGVYPGGEIFELDTSKPYAAGTNPKKIYDVTGVQDRPFGMDIMDNKLLIGTLPSSNNYHGAFTVLDLSDYTATEYTTDTLGASNHSILTITHDDVYAYLGTTVCSGAGTTPATGGAKVIKINMGTGQVVKIFELTSFAGYSNVKAIHGLRISPYNGKLYGQCQGIDFILNPDTLAVEKYNVYDSSAVELNATTTSQMWHETHMQFYGGYLFTRGSILDPDTVKAVATASVPGELAGVWGDKAYYVDTACTVYEMPISCPDTSSTTPDLVWDGFETNEGEYRLEGGVSAYGTMGKTLTKADVAMKVFAGNGNGKNPEQTLDATAPGLVFQPPKTLQDAVFVVGMDFYIENPNVEATLLAPRTTDGTYQMPLMLGKDGELYMIGKHDRKYALGTVEIGKWNKIAIQYTNSSTGGTAATVYVDGTLRQATDTYLNTTSNGIHSQYATGNMDEFDVRIAARTTDNEYLANASYEGRNEYITVDNVFITNNTETTNVGTIITNITVKDSTTIEVTFNKAYEGTLVGTSITTLEGAVSATVTAENVVDTKATLTLDTALSGGETYSYKPSGISEGYNFRTGFEYTATFGSDTDTIVYTVQRAMSKSNGRLAMWSGYGNISPAENENADHNHGEIVAFNMPESVGDSTVVVEFDYYKMFDAVTRISPRFVGQARYTFAPSLDINKDGQLMAVAANEDDTVIGQIEPNTWNKIAMKISLSSGTGVAVTFYINGVECGTFTSTGTEFKQNLEGITFYNTEFAREEGKLLDSKRSDGRPTYVYLDNMVMTSDASRANYGLMAQHVRMVAPDTVLFTTNIDAVVPNKDDVIVTSTSGKEYTAISTKQVSSNSFSITFAEKLAIGDDFGYDIFVNEGNDEIMGSFTSAVGSYIETFDNSTLSNFESLGAPSKQATYTTGRYTSGSTDTALVWSPFQNTAYGPAISSMDKNTGGTLVWWQTSEGNNNPVNNTKMVVSTDFKTGSDRIGGWILAFASGQYGDPMVTLHLSEDNKLTFGGATIDDNFKYGEWHNIALHMYFTTVGAVADVYYDGKLAAENVVIANKNGFWALRTTLTAGTPPEELMALDNRDPARYDVVIFDNMYIGFDELYKTSEIVMEASGEDATMYTGALDRSNPAITALYDSNGAIKDLMIRSFTAEKLSGATFESALTFDGASSGDKVKFFVVSDLLNVTPLSNVIEKTVE
ncbi:MAG: hypothetical protein Q4B31_02000 [Clostridia bacterium]|nr:hypothetical protein [Clostridia bacterium]